MIVNTLVQFSLVLAGIILLTLMYFLVVYISSPDLPEAISGGEEHAGPEQDGQGTGREPRRAFIRCGVIPPSVPFRYRTAGYMDCRTQNMVFNGNLVCEHGCLGLGSCVKICPNDAIVLRNGSVCISDTCTGCGFCVDICPKKLISLVPVDEASGMTCAACGKTDASGYCKTAKEGYRLDFHNLT